MQALCVSGLTRAVRFATESMINAALKCLGAFLRRQFIGVWMAGLSVPGPKIGSLKDNPFLFIKNSSAHHSLQGFFNEKPRGATVFWAPEWVGKTYTLTHMREFASSTADRRVVYVDFSGVVGDNAKQFFYRQMGLDAESDSKPLSQYLPSGVFITFIFDHFEKASETTMIAALAEDSLNSLAYNLLVLVNDSFCAHSLLISCGQQRRREHIRLLGSLYCGRWFSKELGDEWSDVRYNGLVDQCGTLAPMISIRNRTCRPSDAFMLLRVAKIGAEWEHGERLLEQFRIFSSCENNC